MIPLGEGYKENQLADALGNPSRAGLLPPVPYGWPGSMLAVPGPVFGAMLANLLEFLREDGFSRFMPWFRQASTWDLGFPASLCPASRRFLACYPKGQTLVKLPSYRSGIPNSTAITFRCQRIRSSLMLSPVERARLCPNWRSACR